MEHLWSRAVANSGNRWLMGTPENGEIRPKPLPWLRPAHGKEGSTRLYAARGSLAGRAGIGTRCLVFLDKISWPIRGPNAGQAIGSTMRSAASRGTKSACKWGRSKAFVVVILDRRWEPGRRASRANDSAMKSRRRGHNLCFLGGQHAGYTRTTPCRFNRRGMLPVTATTGYDRGRGFESRRSRLSHTKRPANWQLLLPNRARTTAGL
jgi:hypothetical protein